MIEPGSVGETLLWNLWFRAAEARRPDTVLPDPLAVDLVERLDFPFAERFGATNALQAQGQALRAKAFDDEVRAFLARHPDGTVVALGVGLETQRWRVGAGSWITVDLPDTMAVRHELLPTEGEDAVAGSALDDDWLDHVGDGPVLVTAQGLLMYFTAEDAHALLARCAERLPGATIVFDTVPRWFSERTVAGMRGSSGYRPPPMPWGVDDQERARLAAVPGVERLHRVPLPRGRGLFFGWLHPLAGDRLPGVLRYLAPWRTFRAETRSRPLR